MYKLKGCQPIIFQSFLYKNKVISSKRKGELFYNPINCKQIVMLV